MLVVAGGTPAGTLWRDAKATSSLAEDINGTSSLVKLDAAVAFAWLCRTFMVFILHGREGEMKTAAGIVMLSCAAASFAQTVYFNDFESRSTAGFNSSLVSTTPVGNRAFLGRFCNDTVTLSLNDLTPGSYRLAFDFYGIGTWDGSNLPGPDWFIVNSGSTELIRTTFAIGRTDVPSGVQLYPSIGGVGTAALSPGRTGAIENNTLGYISLGIYPRDAVWRLETDFEVTGSAHSLSFRAANLQGIDDESWGLDNVTVTRNIPAPGALATVFGALAVSNLRRRR